MLKKNIKNSTQLDYLRNYFLVNYILSYELHLKNILLEKEKEKANELLQGVEDFEKTELNNFSDNNVIEDTASNLSVEQSNSTIDNSTEMPKTNELEKTEENETPKIEESFTRKNYVQTYNFIFFYLNILGEDFNLINYEEKFEYSFLNKTNLIKFYELDLEFLEEAFNLFDNPNVPETFKFWKFTQNGIFWWISKAVRLKIKKKLKRKRFKKKKLLKRYRVFKKLKKMLSRRRKKIKIFFNKIRYSSSTFLHKNIHPKILNQKMTLTKRLVEDANVFFFFKVNKYPKDEYENYTWNFENKYKSKTESFDRGLTIFWRNYHKKPYNKLRIARIVHWGLFTNKTIRKQRYKGFINTYLKVYQKHKLNMIYFLNYFLGCKVSWTRISKISENFKKYFITWISSNVLALPMLTRKYVNWRILKKKVYKLRKKVGKWSYLNFKRYNLPWLQKRKNFPKFIKHLQPNVLVLSYLAQLEPSTNYMFTVKQLKKIYIPMTDYMKVNYFIKLHMFRYKANKTCMSLLFFIN